MDLLARLAHDDKDLLSEMRNTLSFLSLMNQDEVGNFHGKFEEKRYGGSRSIEIGNEFYNVLVFKPGAYTQYRIYSNLAQRIVIPLISGDSESNFGKLSLKMGDYAMYAPQNRESIFMACLTWYLNKDSLIKTSNENVAYSRHQEHSIGNETEFQQLALIRDVSFGTYLTGLDQHLMTKAYGNDLDNFIGEVDEFGCPCGDLIENSRRLEYNDLKKLY